MRPDILLYLHDCCFQRRDPGALLKTLRCEDVERWGNEFHFDGGVGRVLGLGGAEGVFDGVDAFVGEAGDFDVCADFCRLWRQAFGDVGLEFGFYDVRGEDDFVPDVGVSVGTIMVSVRLL